ncbi:MAG: sugar phosphate isomerase/epimerase [Acidibacillus sp.]|nr:sugar phosphate isomerase/epimerase [Acidibacillus sp.]
MKLGVFMVLFGDKSREDALDDIAQQGLQCVEIGTGGYPGKAHCDPALLLSDASELRKFAHQISSRGLEISALSCHGNPMHPNPLIAQQFHDDFVATVRLAAELGVKTVNTFSGCPGESEHSENPVWVTCSWPEEHARVLEWQWSEKVIPYWTKQNIFLKEQGVRVAIELHPGFVAYNTETMLRLRSECGDAIGVNFDPSHLFWQAMDPVSSIKELGRQGAIFHVHAKDTAIDAHNTAINGVLDTKSFRNEMNRSWIFRTVGYGHGEVVWRQILSALQLVGYQGAVSIEHEDSLMSREEGFQKAVHFLQSNLIKEQVQDVWWS